MTSPSSWSGLLDRLEGFLLCLMLDRCGNLQFSHFNSENEEYYYKLLRGDSEDELNGKYLRKVTGSESLCTCGYSSTRNILAQQCLIIKLKQTLK